MLVTSLSCCSRAEQESDSQLASSLGRSAAAAHLGQSVGQLPSCTILGVNVYLVGVGRDGHLWYRKRERQLDRLRGAG